MRIPSIFALLVQYIK